jgi:hypothetical protein
VSSGEAPARRCDPLSSSPMPAHVSRPPSRAAWVAAIATAAIALPTAVAAVAHRSAPDGPMRTATYGTSSLTAAR